VIAADLIAYVGGNGSLPEKPVMITFDDGFLNNITYAVPLLEQYGMRAVIAVVGKYTEDSEASGDRNPSYAYLNWEDIRQLIASDIVEIQNHSYDLHKKGPRIGADRKKGEAMEDYERILGEDITTYRRLMDEKTGYTAAAFAYPLGEYSKSSEEVLKKQGFSATMTCREKINTITRDPDCLFGLGRFNRPGGVSTGKFFERVLKGY
ncbi:MAG: polysaccharide deacetylase family protein, partial [Oscillospiraceae bacterium]|nr:polysaccharide deacetylase family protein [Oscillospiraceae bacterium]